MHLLDLLARIFSRSPAQLPPPAPIPAPTPLPVVAPIASPPPATGPRGTKGVQSRAWRNRNPGNLRLRSTKKPVDHVAVDNDPGGPFGIYASEHDGQADLAARIIQLWDGGTRWIGYRIVAGKPERGIIAIWAPESDGNNTASYIKGVAGALGVRPDQDIPDPRDISVMTTVADAIRRHEGKASDPAWDPVQREAGFRLAGCVVKERRA